jgi:dethiobiotin synthetase
MHKGIFITGTDTAVGKTFVAAGLVRAFKEKGFNVCPMKPVESGCRVRKGKLIPSDTLKLITAADVNEAVDLINPYRFRQPLAPSVAAELEGVKINRKTIFSAYNRLSKKYDLTIVEGAGGIMVPVYRTYLFLDLINDLRLPVVVVSRPGLGTINHTLLTIEAARARRIEVAGVIINCSTRGGIDISVKSNPDVIEKVGGAPVLGIIPYRKKPETDNKSIFLMIAERILSRL